MCGSARWLVPTCFRSRLEVSPRTPRSSASNLHSGRHVASHCAYNERRGIVFASMTDFKKKLQDEIAALEYELRNELPKEILKARAHGDLSENAEYHAAKERQGFVNARLNHLKQRMADISMIDFSKIPHGRVGLGSRVVVLEVKKDEKITYNLVTTEEADAANGKISTNSPIGRGLLGKEVGDTVKVTIPGGVREFEILELITIHELAK